MTPAPHVLLFNDQTEALATALLARHPDAQISTCHRYSDLADVLNRERPEVAYAIRFDGSVGYPTEALFGPNGPKWIANGGVGVDHFGIWDPDHVTVTNAAGVAADMMAEFLMGGFLHFTLAIDRLQADQTARRWAPQNLTPLKGKTLLIVGLGHTGRALAKRADAFGMTVLGTRARPQPMDHVAEVFAAKDLAQALPRADFLAVATPLTDQTRHLINAEALDCLKPGAIIGDVSRGGVVDQTALLEALGTGQVAAAVLDVFETEPLPIKNPLWSQEKVLISPHGSSLYDGWEAASFEIFLSNLDKWRAGQPLVNVVDPSRGY